MRVALAPPAVEDEFRAVTIAADRRVAAGLTLVTIVFVIATIPVTFALRDDPDRLHLTWGIRAVATLIAGTAFILLRRVESSRTYDTIVTAWVAIWFGAIIAENALLPAGHASFVAWDVFITVATYAAVPLSLPRQVALALLFSAADLVVLWRFKTPTLAIDLSDVALAFACANVVGVFVSRERHTLRRRSFLAVRQEVAARQELEAALHEVKTLQGIIPICAHCKNIRTDAGEWQQVEAYVRSHSDAQFSHGICPNCMKLHYPDIPED